MASSSGLVQLLGETLQGRDGTTVETSKALAGKAAIALYFSAHWCPPCKGFTPKLAEWYSKDLQAKGLEIVFVSSDSDEDSFKSYFGEMPWLALPYADREKKESLSKRFKVRGIPSVVILDSDGGVISTDGRSAISNDPTGQEFPWKPRSVKEIMDGCKIIDKSGAAVDASQALSGKTLALYFSAHWCPPCRGFTPKLAEWYSKDLQAKGLEVVFVSSDRDEESFKSYFGEQPWLALDYSCRKEKEELSTAFGVQGIPSLVILDGQDFSIINKDGRSALSADPEGKNYPWHPKPVFDLAMGPGCLEDSPCVVAFCESSSDAATEVAEKAMEPMSKKLIEAAKASGSDVEVGFMIAKSQARVPDRLRELMKLPALSEDVKEECPPKLMIVDVSNGEFAEGPEGDVTCGSVEKFVADFKAGLLEKKTFE